MKIEFRCNGCDTVKEAHVDGEDIENRPRVKTKQTCGECGIERVWVETISSRIERGWEFIDIE